MPPRKKKPTGPTPVDAITHGDKRTNIPTADAHDLVTPEHEKTETVVYPRDLRAPMLVWQGKAALDETDLEADAPPVYIQEKIEPPVPVAQTARRQGRERGGRDGVIQGGGVL